MTLPKVATSLINSAHQDNIMRLARKAEAIKAKIINEEFDEALLMLANIGHDLIMFRNEKIKKEERKTEEPNWLPLRLKI